MTDAIPIILTGTYKNGPEGRDRTSKGIATGFTDQPASTYGLPLDIKWFRRRDSNPQSTESKSVGLPISLHLN